MNNILLSTFLILNIGLMAQSNYQILHYTETSGWDHQTRGASLAFFQSLPNMNITDDQTGNTFNDIVNLLNYDLIVFSNTSGNSILDSTQRSHFETYINQGGAILGIHAATDTYRHSSANGNNTGTWDFYPQTIGGSVQENPHHVSGTPAYNISIKRLDQISMGIPNPWLKNEEFYYWENGYLDSSNINLLSVEETIGPNGQLNSYDSSRTVAWKKEIPSGSRVFYTSLGHLAINFSSDTLFQKLISQAMDWCLGKTTGIKSLKTKEVNLFPNPSNNRLYLSGNNSKILGLKINNLHGDSYKLELEFPIKIDKITRGVYFLAIEFESYVQHIKFIKL
jgi:type 1 glutamine amidotransferase